MPTYVSCVTSRKNGVSTRRIVLGVASCGGPSQQPSFRVTISQRNTHTHTASWAWYAASAHCVARFVGARRCPCGAWPSGTVFPCLINLSRHWAPPTRTLHRGGVNDDAPQAPASPPASPGNIVRWLLPPSIELHQIRPAQG